ncbi:MAG: alcohol dehydrogenase catalytic domain-containing protein [Acidimicrobiales bacterium]
MRAVVIDRPGSVEVADVPDPQPAPDEVVVAVKACGICGTDIHIMDGEFEATGYPITPGHEFAGEVVVVGAAVGGGAGTGIRVGSRVAVDPSLFCGTCRACRSGHGNLCERWNAVGVTKPGAAAELVAVPAASAQVLPDGFDFSAAALIEPLSCAVHGYDLISAKLGDRFCIYGAGTMGLLLLMLAYRAGALSVAVVDPNVTRLDMARRLGATEVAPRVDELPSGRSGFEVVMDATGVVAAIEDALCHVARGGTYLQFGVAAVDAMARVSPFRIYNDEIRMVGSMAVLASYERARDLAVEGGLDLQALVSDVVPLSSYADALTNVRRGTGYKTQVAP